MTALVLLDDDLFPKWSEAWFVKEITIPSGFLEEETVTLLLSTIDDVDVVYINGTPVAASGFITVDKVKADPTSVPATQIYQKVNSKADNNSIK